MSETKSVLVTGGSSGVGLAIAQRLKKEGWQVYIGSRKLVTGESLYDLSCVALDVTDEQSVEAAVAYILSKEGKLDGLVNSAGFVIAGALEELSVEELHQQLDVNLYGTLRMVRAVLPGMRERKSGVILSIGSVAGFVTVPYQAAYSVSKYALEAFMEGLAMEVKPLGIRAAILDPGDMKTGFTASRNYSAQTANTNYRPYLDRAIHMMVHDELNGSTPDACARAAAKYLSGNSKKRRMVIGFEYKMVNALRRSLPLRTSSAIVSMLYNSKEKNDGLWSFERDVLKKI